MDEDTGTYLEYGKTGDPALFRMLWDKYKMPVLGTLFRVLHSSREEAEDLLQEVFIKVMEERQKFVARAKFSTWLYRIALNRAFNAVRNRKETVPADETLEDANQDHALNSLVAVEKQTLLKEALGRLNARQRAALVLKEFEEKTYLEIAEIMDCSLEAVESLLFHARTRLRQLLKENHNES